MNQLTTPTLTEDQARDILNGWAGGGFLRLRNMGDKIFVTRFTPGCAYTIRVHTHYEERKVERVAVPHHGGPIDDHGQVPDLWSVPVPRPREFEDSKEHVPVPHTERVELCSQCAGEGRVVCPTCHGRGQKACPQCNGSGIRHEQVTATERDASGNTRQVSRFVQVRCACGDGQVRCNACSGLGVQTCSQCTGTGRMKVFEQVAVHFKPVVLDELLDVTPVPDRWFRQLSGDTLVNEKSSRVDRFDPVAPDVDRKAGELLTRSHGVDGAQSRIILQTLKVDRVPLNELDYKYAGVERKLWICGQENQIYAPKAPWNRSLFTVLTGVGLLAAGALIAGVVYLLVR
ncbi:MAG: hypothetical protein HYX69_06750 [Planctomycetia bacterium]|nr:hypothetical protein [Planctomycetia bacterium]